MRAVPKTFELILLFNAFVLCIISSPALATTSDPAQSYSTWQEAADLGLYDEAVELSQASGQDGALQRLIAAANAKQLSAQPQWLAFIHYKRESKSSWLSQVDSPHFFMSNAGKRSPDVELNATLAALFSNQAKPPLRLTAHCRFVARRVWLAEQLPNLASLIPPQDCIEFERYVEFLDAEVLTLVFPTAHPNSPSSAFGHTLLRIDKKDQRAESRLLNMSLNFAADVPPEVSGTAYALKGLNGGFEGRFRLLPYHIKLREYGQIENRDTWEYELTLDKPAVDLVLRHAYEMLISHFDYYFFSENCSYHLLSLLEVAFPDKPLTEEFEWWTIPVDTIRKLDEHQLSKPPRFVPSSIRTLRARQTALGQSDVSLSLQALKTDLDNIDAPLKQKSAPEQAAILDLLSDYERYKRLKTDPSAKGSSPREIAILSRRSKLGIKSTNPLIEQPTSSPDAGHGTSRIGIQHHYNREGSTITELSFRPAYHDFRDPSTGFDDKAAIEMALISVAHDADADKFFLKQFTLLSIESLEPRGIFFKPVSWHTNIQWQRAHANARHQFSFNVGAGTATQSSPTAPAFFVFAEADLINNPGLRDRTQLRFGASLGAQWEAIPGLRTGIETNFRQQLNGESYSFITEAWAGFAIGDQLSVNIDLAAEKRESSASNTRVTLGLRSYF
jgi:hypothetical protein